MNYIFQVRHWNIDFFINLEKILLSKQIGINIVWLTMEKETFNKINISRKNVYYLPDEFINNKSQDTAERLVIDRWMYQTYGFGLEFIYEMERFKTKAGDKLNFVNAHVEVLNRIIPENSKMISLTCDHFVYFISAIINRMKKGKTYFIQPCGFPLNAQVIMENPWDLLQFRSEPLAEKLLDDYFESLTKSPMESINYMKPQKMISLKSSIYKRIKKVFGTRIENNIFTYLEAKSKNIIPERYTQLKKIPYRFSYIHENELKSLSQKGNIFYFPLQFEPEMTILAYSPWFKSQLEVIRLISQSLKQGDILLLKENPKMIGQRDKNYYAEISQFNQVLWAEPGVNSRNIIRNSFKVLSLTGTATIEAACMGIDSLLFGFPPFHKLLIEEPIANQNISNFIETLYRSHPSDAIINHVKKEWPEFSKSLFYGNLIPQYINDIFTIIDSADLSKRFSQEVLLVK